VRGRHLQPGKFDVTVSINRQRFRAGREYAQPPPAGGTRIAVLGDSMTFGWGAGDQDTYPAQLENVLRRDGAVEVINAGYPGTCLGEKALTYALTVRPFEPRIVVLTILGDDVDGDLYWRVFSLAPDGSAAPTALSARGPRGRVVSPIRDVLRAGLDYGFLAQHSQLFGLLRKALTRVASRERTTSLGQAPATAAEIDRFRGEGLALLAAEVRWLRAQTTQAGAEMAVVFVPFRDSIYPSEGWWPDEIRWKSRAVSEALVRVCAALGVPYRDVTLVMATRAKSSPRPLYYDGVETHPTPEGYRALAEAVAEFLAEQGWVGGRR
jgi:lysophospholipase L1-like esterase